ncbi:MAG: adenine phosphoribosyltransferase [Candidatus Abyssobacteria bacterium SURF_17]|jgi:adenine phosphoribosyltransferase|uniref:Adenine phosphoribosyltransferase n=1 Tax=Candidatus Abyssobacteria bacterium SURF_17 TaxID=2093361 RepID=A0A419EUL0_9BACT|nr:MAG: adenine phosphoribosyltransferase [Candidatus Abyssubacteria bacterium SURF_17]
MPEKLKESIRNIPNFPKKGILFRDITTLLKDKAAFADAVNTLAARNKGKGVKKVVGMESRGFILGAPIAYLLGAGFVPVRKKGKLPADTYSAKYELEYGTDHLEIHKDAIEKGEKVLIVDDLLATGGTAVATINLMKNFDAEIVGLDFLIELTELAGREKLKGYEVFSLVQF